MQEQNANSPNNKEDLMTGVSKLDDNSNDIVEDNKQQVSQPNDNLNDIADDSVNSTQDNDSSNHVDDMHQTMCNEKTFDNEESRIIRLAQSLNDIKTNPLSPDEDNLHTLQNNSFDPIFNPDEEEKNKGFGQIKEKMD